MPKKRKNTKVKNNAVRKEILKQSKLLGIKRELANQELTKYKMEDYWRKILLKMKLPIMKEDVQVSWNVFQRTLDKKDACIAELCQQFEDCEVQQHMSVAIHHDAVSLQLDRFRKFIDYLQSLYRRDVSSVKRTACLVQKRERLDWREEERAFGVLSMALKQHHERQLDTFYGESMAMHEETDKLLLIACQDMLDILEFKSYAEIMDKFRDTLDAYADKNTAVKLKMDVLLQKDTKMRNIIRQQEQRLLTNDVSLVELREKLELHESKTMISENLAEYREKKGVCMKGKKEMAVNVRRDREKFVDLVEVVNVTTKRLESILKKGDQIVSLVKACYKLMTPEERCNWPIDGQKLFVFSCDHHQDTSSGVANKADYEGIEWFWKQVANANIVKEMLIKEKQALMKENDQLKNILQQWIMKNSKLQNLK